MPQRVSMRIWAHEHFKGRHWFVRKQNLFYFLFTGNIHNKPSHPHFSITYFPNDLKNKWPALHNPTDFSAGNKKRQCKKQHPSKHSHLWTSQPESSSKYSEAAPHFQPGADTARAQGGFSASGAHVIHTKVPELRAPRLSCFAGSLPIQWSSLPSSQENARLTVSPKQKGTGGRNPERSCKGKP